MIRRKRFAATASIWSSATPVLEHVGGHEQRSDFARWVRELGTHYWVQTPNRYFPVEPHWLFPGFQFPPDRTRAHVMRRWPLGSGGGDWTFDEALEIVQGVE